MSKNDDSTKIEQETPKTKETTKKKLADKLKFKKCLFYNFFKVSKNDDSTKIEQETPKKTPRIPRNAVSRLPALFHKIEVHL